MLECFSDVDGELIRFPEDSIFTNISQKSGLIAFLNKIFLYIFYIYILVYIFLKHTLAF